MGLVYRAYHAQLERSAAVKFLQGIAAGPDAVVRFHHEAQAIAQMRHPNIVNVFDFGDYLGTPYMVVEYVPGGNLAARLEQTPLDQATALKYLRGIAAGLDYAHSLGIVHRDVKPGNVLLEKDGTPVLADFGLVKLLQGSSLKSMTGVTTGTPAYMAPEQVTGREVGPPADQYSLVTMAYEMLTGSIPFAGEGMLELLYAHVHRDPPPASSRNTALSASVDEVIRRGLAKDPNARWESCTAFVDALAAALADATAPAADGMVGPAPPVAVTMPLALVVSVHVPSTASAAHASSAATVAVAMPAGSATPTAPRGKQAKPRRRLYEIVAGSAVLLLALLGGGICAAADQKPMLSVDPRIAVPGERVTVSASHLPVNQVGEIQLRSQLYTFPFRSDASGNLSQQIEIPLDIGIGGHHVLLCWSASCPVQAALIVVAPGTLPAPTPSANPSPAASGGPHATPSPGRSPRPGATPASSTGASPTPGSSPKPSPNPRPSPTPIPTPTPATSITLVSVSSLGKTTVTFHYFYAGSATVSVCQNGSCHAAGTVTVVPGSATSVQFKTPPGILLTAPLVAGPAYVIACAGSCLTSNSVSVGA